MSRAALTTHHSTTHHSPVTTHHPHHSPFTTPSLPPSLPPFSARLLWLLLSIRVLCARGAANDSQIAHRYVSEGAAAPSSLPYHHHHKQHLSIASALTPSSPPLVPHILPPSPPLPPIVQVWSGGSPTSGISGVGGGELVILTGLNIAPTTDGPAGLCSTTGRRHQHAG